LATSLVVECADDDAYGLLQDVDKWMRRTEWQGIFWRWRPLADGHTLQYFAKPETLPSDGIQKLV